MVSFLIFTYLSRGDSDSQKSASDPYGTTPLIVEMSKKDVTE